MHMLHLTNYWSWQTYSEDWAFSALIAKTLQQLRFVSYVVAVPGGTTRSLLWHPSVQDYVAKLSVCHPCVAVILVQKWEAIHILCEYMPYIPKHSKYRVDDAKTVCLSLFPDFSNSIHTVHHFLINNSKNIVHENLSWYHMYFYYSYLIRALVALIESIENLTGHHTNAMLTVDITQVTSIW